MPAFSPNFPSLELINDSGVRPIFKLLSDFSYHSNVTGQAHVAEAGFETDLCSVPQLGMAFIGYPGGRAGIIHDWLVTYPGIDRETADLVFREALKTCGVDDATAAWMYSAVAGYTKQLRQMAQGDNPYRGA